MTLRWEAPTYQKPAVCQIADAPGGGRYMVRRVAGSKPARYTALHNGVLLRPVEYATMDGAKAACQGDHDDKQRGL